MGAIIGHRGLLLAGSGAAAWTPLALAIPPTILADHLSTITNDGTNASSWSDRSGNGNTLNANISAQRPLYNAADIAGFGAVRGTNGTIMNLVSSTAVGIYNAATQGWMFAVYRQIATGTSGFRLLGYASTNTGGNARLSLLSDTATAAGKPAIRVRRLDADAAVQLTASTSCGDGSYHMVLGWMNWGTQEGRIYIDGSLDASNATLIASGGSTSATNSSAITVIGDTINTANTTSSAQAVAAMGTTLPSSIEIDKLFGYYAHQLALTGNLPVGHPYKTSPP